MENAKMKKIIGIGGAVVKTGAHEHLKENIDDIEMIIYNGGALFHDFQLALEGYTSVPITELNKSLKKIEYSGLYLWDWLRGEKPAPEGSLARLCEDKNIPVLLFTALPCDYWQLLSDDWGLIANRSNKDFKLLKERFQKPFHYINMGSAVIHPEVFLKAMQGIKHNDFKADVVDFLDMYRPRTRVSKEYGKYYQMTFNEFMEKEFEKLK
ncbi:MAG: hypothetical protein PHH54_00575 [Candidatus Nanoarchaeia archaeon]|nr:hypothetical protein [Candidatus Nanoarchaeia archaeon]MDD5740457.1 hypothetical protein [Candidatus Nanoarchaeia archaeon]